MNLTIGAERWGGQSTPSVLLAPAKGVSVAPLNTHTLLFYQPGHFHAALTLRQANPRVARDVHVYATEGPELDSFGSLIEAFNQRQEQPTDWNLHIHVGADPLAQLVSEARGDVVVLAGRNQGKLAAIQALHQAGMHVLADKPWITDDQVDEDLAQVTGGPPLCMDIMTERHDTVARLRKALLGADALLGAPLVDGDQPAFEIGSTHHLYKVVNGQPLRRPPWYYDVRVQGDGLVDIQTHMTDQAQWLFEGVKPLDLVRDFELISARRWDTEVPLELFAQSTGLEQFPSELQDRVGAGGLALACNGEIEYRLRGHLVRQTAIWGQREPPGSGDLHYSTVRGELGTLQVEHNAIAGHQPDITVVARGGSDLGSRVARVMDALQTEFPGLFAQARGNGFALHLPETIRTSHESHFAQVLEEFLDFVDAGTWPAALSARIKSRHSLLAQAWTMAASP